MTYRILSFDGGGIRGVLTLTLLQRLTQAAPKLVQNADLLAGTSTGGIIALALAAGKSLSDVLQLYRDHGREIFDRSWLRDVADLGDLLGAEYDPANLQRLLQAEFGDLRLDQLNRRVLIPSFELDNGAADPARRTWKPVFFHNFPGSDSDGAEQAVAVALSTSAAPTYFPSHGVFIDGGVAANNPSLAALAQTQDPRAELQPRPALADVRLLSLGTGAALSYIAGTAHDWGSAQWVKPLVNLLLDANLGIADYQCAQLLRDHYWRLAPTFPPGTNFKLDDWERVDDMIRFAEGVELGPTLTWLEQTGW